MGQGVRLNWGCGEKAWALSPSFHTHGPDPTQTNQDLPHQKLNAATTIHRHHQRKLTKKNVQKFNSKFSLPHSHNPPFKSQVNNESKNDTPWIHRWNQNQRRSLLAHGWKKTKGETYRMIPTRWLWVIFFFAPSIFFYHFCCIVVFSSVSSHVHNRVCWMMTSVKLLCNFNDNWGMMDYCWGWRLLNLCLFSLLLRLVCGIFLLKNFFCVSLMCFCWEFFFV